MAYLEREQLQEAQRIARIGSWEWEPDSKVITWSEGLYLILGRPLELGPPTFAMLRQCYTPDSWTLLEPAIMRAMELGESYELELAMIREDGGICWTATRGEAVRGRDGAVVRLRGTVHDITERKLAEKAYREREAQLREAQRIAGIGSWEWEIGSEIVTWSDGLCLLLGYAFGDAPTFSTLPRRYTPESWSRLERAVERAVSEGKPYELELEMIRGDGGTCWTTTRGEAVRGPDGRFLMLRGTVHDITERKRLQATNAQADRLSSMGVIAAGVAHEINNPLTYVRHNVESLAIDLPRLFGVASRCAAALRECVGDAAFASVVGDDAAMLSPSVLDDAVDRVREAVEGTQRISVLIRSLGTFSRVEKVEEQAVDLTHAIESALNMAQNEMRFRARVITDFRTVPAVWASEGKLSQVFLNLLINAAHAIDEGHIDENVIQIRTWATEEDVFAQVTDTGAGIPPDELDRIFEPFFSTKQIGRGSGLGLTICKGLVTAFGGDISVTSEVGVGSCFTVRLPVRRAVDVQDHPSGPVPALTARGRILVVDDEPMIQKTLQRLLTDDHEVVTAGSGVAARTILERDQAFDVILCDLMMPEMTGMDLHAWLVAHHPSLAEQLVFVTGGIFTPRAADYLASVSNPRVHKPFDIDALELLIADLVQAARRR